MHIVVDIVLSFIGWFLMYIGLCVLDGMHQKFCCDFWYVKPEKWTKNAGLTWLIVFFIVLALF